MTVEQCMTGRDRVKREKNPSPMPDDTAHITVIIFFLFPKHEHVPTDIPRLGVSAGTYCHGDPG